MNGDKKAENVKRHNGTPDLSVNTKHAVKRSKSDLKSQDRSEGQARQKDQVEWREKPPSKDGAVQKAAGEVAGLKDYVRLLLVHGR